MKVDVWELEKRNGYIIVPEGAAPPTVKPGFVPVSKFKSLDLHEDQPRVAMDIREVITNIEMQGWHAVEPIIKIVKQD